MIRKGQSGGLIGINSFLRKEDRSAANSFQVRAAQVSMRVQSVRVAGMKEGLQSLYADAEDVLNRYKDFDIVKAMQDRENMNVLWVRARAIDADTVNANGDFFSKQELLADVEVKGKKIPAYKTFEGCPIYSNHENDDIDKAKGVIIYAEWDEKENCVYCTFIVDGDSHPHTVSGIRGGILHDVSMGCFTAGTQVLTSNGFLPIEKISQNDTLVDSNGYFTNIVNKQIKNYNGDLVCLDIEGGAHIESTIEHPYLVFKEEDWKKRNSKVPAQGVGNKNKWVSRVIEPQYINANDLKIGDRVVTPKGGSVVDIDGINLNRARIIGYFLAEGNYIKQKNDIVSVQFNFALDEENTLAQETTDLINKEFENVSVRKCLQPSENLCILSVSEKYFAHWIHAQCGEYSYGKILNRKLLYADVEIQKNLIGAWLSGDGYLRKLKKYPNSNTMSGCTVSKKMALDLSHIMNRIGLVHSKRASFNGKVANYNDAVNSSNKAIDENGRQVAFYFDIASSKCSVIADYTCFKGQYSTSNTNNEYSNFIARPITKISRKFHNGLVFNFETESHNYIVADIAVHNCQVERGECSECKNEATTERDYCDCLKKHKGKTLPGTTKKVYEKNKGLKFIELSVVGDGAFDTCEIDEIYHVEDILEKAKQLQKTSQSIHNGIVVAESKVPTNLAERHAFENCLRQISDTTDTAVRLAQTAGTLVGGNLMAGEGANGNTTVGKILQFLGIDATAGLNILDMLNLALNFLEVAVMNLFARKDNVDLTHVGKITKSMADLQSTMQDMIDDGVDSGGGKGNAPINQGALQGQGQPGQSPAAPAPAAPGGQMPTQNSSFNYNSAGTVGRAFGPVMQTQDAAFGGGAVASTNSPVVVWASKSNKNKPRRVMASIRNSVPQSPKITRMSENLITLANDLGIDMTGYLKEISNKTNVPEKVIGGNMNEYSIEEQMANELSARQASRYRVSHDFEDNNGNKVTLSSDGDIKAFVDNKPVKWQPYLNQNQIQAIAQKKIVEVGDALLTEFGNIVKTAKSQGKVITSSWEPNQNHDTVMEEQIDKKRKGTFDKVQEELLGDEESKEYKRQGYDNRVREETLEEKRTGTDDEVRELLLGDEAGLYKRRGTDDDVKENLLNDARHGFPDKVIEEQLEEVRRKYTPADAQSVMVAAVSAMGTAVVTARATPEEILEEVNRLASRKDLAELIHVASLGNKHRRSVMARNNFHEVKAYALTPESALLDALGAEVNEKSDARNISEAIVHASKNTDRVLGAITKFAKSKIGQSKNHYAQNSVELTREDEFAGAIGGLTEGQTTLENDHIKSSILAMAMACEDSKSSPDEIIEVVALTDRNKLIREVEIARTEKASKHRINQRKRADYWSKIEASNAPAIENVREAAVGALADYAIVNDFSSGSLVDAAQIIANMPNSTEKLVTSALHQSRMKRSAAIEIRDDKTTTKTITCNADDLGGLNIKDPGFDDVFRQAAIKVMTDNGYQVDPGTFSFTNLSVTSNGEITAEVSSRVSKSFTADSNGGMNQTQNNVVTDNNVAASGDADVTMVSPDVPETVSIDSEAPENNDPSESYSGEEKNLISASVKATRRAKRDFWIKKLTTAQASPAGGGAAPGLGGPPTGGMDMGQGDPTGLGASALTTDPAAADATPGADPMGVDDTPEPGEKKPWGTVCPSCGSTDVDIANGEGNCNSCNSNLKYSFNVEVVPASDSKAKADDAEGGTGGEGADQDMGLGAATAPGATAPGGGVGGGAAPGGATGNMMMQASYVCDPDVFVRTAQSDFDVNTEKLLPPGFICPNCGDRKTSQTKSPLIRVCYKCPTVITSSVKPFKDNPKKVVASVRWLIS